MHGFTALAPNGRHLAVLTLLLALSAHSHSQALAGDYPDRAVKIVVPFPAGGTADVIPRIVGEWLSRKWGQPVVIENRTGAAGNIGSEQAYRSAPDGYTLLSSPPPPLVINQNLYPKLGFDPAKFEPIIVLAQVPNALIVNPNNVKANNLAEFIEYLRNNPDKLICATQGNGTTSHLTSELFQLMAKVKLRHIPYRGSAPALQGLLAGDVDVMFDNLGVSLPLVQAGNLNCWQWPRPAACRRCLTCRRSQKCSAASRRSPGMASSRHPALRRTSPRRSMPMSTRCCVSPKCRSSCGNSLPRFSADRSRRRPAICGRKSTAGQL